MLIDEVDITITAGHGGKGKVSFGRMLGSGPDGGDGGKGASVYAVATSDLRALIQFSKSKHIEGQNGEPGKSKRQAGKDALDLELSLPIGTHIIDFENKSEIEINDLSQRVLLCKGGLGGRGNFEFRSATNQAPEYAQPGLPGESKNFRLILKLIAKYGLIGLPNAGKSSLLNELTNANATVGAYPFTTLEPNLGVLNKVVIADIPGLIEGASTGRGLGIKFLKHIDKVNSLLHCISAESEDVINDFNVVSQELEKYSQTLSNKKRIILLTKTDLVSMDKISDQLNKLKKLNLEIMSVSIHDFESIQNLKNKLV